MKWMLTCKEISELLSEVKDNEISFGKKIMLKMHLSMCHHCKRYQKQLDTLYQVYQKISFKIETDEEIHLSKNEKTDIKKSLKNPQAQ